MKNRISIFVLYCENGVMQDYVEIYIKNLLKISARTIVVINGTIDQVGSEILRELGCDVIIRDNSGFDFGAWRDALIKIGFDEIKKYDELILCNSSCYCLNRGFDDAFNRICESECDFWGMTEHKGNSNVKNPYVNGEYLLKHLQSYFIVCRNKLLMDGCFEEYWKKLNVDLDWEKIVWNCEVEFTSYFENKGFKSAVCFSVSSDCFDPTFYNARELIKKGCPLVKRKVFCENCIVIQNLGRNIATDVFEEIKSRDIKLYSAIWSDLLNTRKLSKIDRVMPLSKIIPDDYTCELSGIKSIAVIIFGYYLDQVKYVGRYMMNLPEDASFYVISPKQEVLGAYENYFMGKRKCTFIKCANRGRDLGAMLTVGKEVFDNYDIVCCAKDKKSPHAGSVYARDFNEHCFESLYSSSFYCKNVLRLFEEEEKLGMIIPYAFNTLYFNNNGNKLGNNKKDMKKLMEILNIKTQFDEEPLAPFGSMFYIRSVAMKTMLSKKWTLNDFPDEPIGSDGTILHAIERIFPMAVQNDGYFTLRVATSKIVTSYLNTMEIRELDFKNGLFDKIKHLNVFKFLKYIFLSKLRVFDIDRYYINKIINFIINK